MTYRRFFKWKIIAIIIGSIFHSYRLHQDTESLRPKTWQADNITDWIATTNWKNTDGRWRRGGGLVGRKTGHDAVDLII